MASLWLHPLTPLALISLAFSAGMAAYANVGLTPSTDFMTLWYFGSAFFAVAWAVTDARRRFNTPCFDFGQLVWQYFWISIPWYCVRSRGWFGLLVLLMLIGLFLLPTVSYIVVWIAVHGVAAGPV